ncbi:MAG: SAM-dependent methyltransferase, partial [Paracoccaceae bacterium]
ELPFDSPEYITALAHFYDDWAERLTALSGDIIVLCEGDPFFYGSFMHLYTRLQNRCEIEVIPGITGMSGCWTASGLPITWGDDVLSVLMATLCEADLIHHMGQADAFVIMKTGRNLPKVRRALEKTGKLGRAWLVERGTMVGQRVVPLAQVDSEDCPYFAIVLVHGQGRRPAVTK